MPVHFFFFYYLCISKSVFEFCDQNLSLLLNLPSPICRNASQLNVYIEMRAKEIITKTWKNVGYPYIKDLLVDLSYEILCRYQEQI